MSLVIDSLVDIIRDSVEDADTTHDEWQRAVEMAFDSPRHVVLDEVRREMHRTDENLESPTAGDYAADLIRHLNNLLPDKHRFFDGDYENPDGSFS